MAVSGDKMNGREWERSELGGGTEMIWLEIEVVSILCDEYNRKRSQVCQILCWFIFFLLHLFYFVLFISAVIFAFHFSAPNFCYSCCWCFFGIRLLLLVSQTQQTNNTLTKTSSDPVIVTLLYQLLYQPKTTCWHSINV